MPPKHLVVLGGGFNGVELASIYRALGSKVTLIEARETILAGWGSVVGGKVLEGLVQGGVTVKTGHPFTEEMLPSDCDMVLVAPGRSGNTKGLALEKIGIQWDILFRLLRSCAYGVWSFQIFTR